MRVRHVQCPVCGTLLSVQPGIVKCFVRCGMCQHRFRLPRRIAITDDAIAEWLWQGKGREEEEEAAKPSPPQPPPSGETAVLPALTDAIRLVRADNKGALFEFPTKRLRETDFRTAIPRRCIRCGTRSHLEAHLVIYSSKLLDSYSLEAERSTGNLSVPGSDLYHLQGPELLSYLPEVPDVPPPGNLPMPYWLCDMCTGSGTISGQIQINPDTDQGVCRLLIRSLPRAEEFLVAAGGLNTQYHMELRRQITAVTANPWNELPEAVQHRLGTWYRPGTGERFVAYVADRDRSRAEDGMSGIVVTNHRLIYHTQLRQREAKVTEQIKFQMSTSGTRPRLRIKSPFWEVKRFTVDRDGLARFRRALTAARFKAVWY